MYSYVAFLRQPRGSEAGAEAATLVEQFRRTHPDWTLSIATPGLSLFYAALSGRAEPATILPGSHGVILGNLFPSDLRVPPRGWTPLIDERVAEEMVRTRGRKLVESYWGGYIAFLTAQDCSAHYVLRDCSGKIPCYTVAHRGVTIVTANIEDLAGLSLAAFSINSLYMAGFVYEAELCQRECALREVSELLAGECLELNGVRTRQFALWDPREVCRAGIVEDFEDASRQVAAVTQACVDSWASKYDRVVHHLSGGLDSSMVLGCLNRSVFRPHITCVHLESGGSGESERTFAQLAADTAGVELVFQAGFPEHSRFDERILALSKAPKPSVAHLGTALQSDLRRVIPEQVGAEAIWDGQGGDHLFFESRSVFGAVDYAFLHGFGHEFTNHIRDSVRMSRQSYWSVLRKSIRLGILRSQWRPEDEYSRGPAFLNPEILPANIVDYVWQPWSADASDLPPGKRWQINLLACLIHRHRPVPGLQAAEDHHPLFSQPLFELCLRIPIHTLLRGGINRSLERHAFRDCVPDQIIRRQNKGTITTSFMSKIRESLPFVRDLILDGVLVRERILERSALEPFLAADRPINHGVLWPFLSCLAAEVWARKWQTSGWRV